MTAQDRGPFIELPWDGHTKWWDNAACGSEDPELFFPREGATSEEKRNAEWTAKRICLHCPVRGRCLQVAIERDETYGIWGGLSARERAKSRTRVSAAKTVSIAS
jgi:WhiB family redox-sensing transcriptional regulator